MVLPLSVSAPGAITVISPAFPEVLVEVLNVLPLMLISRAPRFAAALCSFAPAPTTPPLEPNVPHPLPVATQIAPAGPLPVVAEDIIVLLIEIGPPTRSISPACCTPLVAASRLLLAMLSDPDPPPASTTIVPRVPLGCAPAA